MTVFVSFSSGFSDLSQDDQLILIKTGFFEIWLTRMARMFNRNDNVLLFEDGSLIAREELDIVYNVSKEVLDMVYNVSEEELDIVYSVSKEVLDMMYSVSKEELDMVCNVSKSWM